MENQTEASGPGGRPTKYKSDYCEQAKKLSLLGATDVQMADFFEVNPDTIYEWQKVYPEFSEAIRAGKVRADAEIAYSLYDRARGAEWTEERPFKVKKKWYDDNGRVCEEEEIKTVSIKCAAPPDTQAASLWLRNRRPENWRETQHIEQTVKPMAPPIDHPTPEDAANAYNEALKK